MLNFEKAIEIYKAIALVMRLSSNSDSVVMSVNISAVDPEDENPYCLLLSRLFLVKLSIISFLITDSKYLLMTLRRVMW